MGQTPRYPSVDNRDSASVSGIGRVWQRYTHFIDRTFQFWAILPTVLVLVFLTLQPALRLLEMSFSNVTFAAGREQWEFVGLAHARTMLEDPVVWTALRNTFLYVVVVVVIETVLGLILAFMVSRAGKAGVLYRAVYVIPLLIPPVAIGTIWRLMYDYNYGIINQIFTGLGLEGPLWLADPGLAMVSVVIVDIWHWTSFLFLILLAGVQSLPEDVIEAARVDGATELQIYRRILIPLMAPTILVALMLRTILAFKVFDQIFLLTGGGPGTATEMISLYIFDVFFTQFRLGYGAFLALVTALLITVMVVVYAWVNNRIQRSL